MVAGVLNLDCAVGDAIEAGDVVQEGDPLVTLDLF
ncbi:MAG: hypothetical protein JWN68_685 [Nocardioides sp.]|jgi:hypothetical protein|nr:hypothetical protein [Nocardioides sp.]